MKRNTLTKEQEEVLIHGSNEWPFTGKYDNFYEKGVYVCGWCNAPLYLSDNKFDAGCGWPAFDDEIKGAITRHLELDGRTEIRCAHCGGHLGHVFEGEGFTEKEVRHCVASLALNFIPAGQPLPPVADEK
jgi:methionine-R-sulfoxide reductase